MVYVLLIIAMLVVGLIIGAVAGLIWKENRPYGARGDYLIAVITAVVVGMVDWYVIPAMGFSETLRNISLFLEPALGALLVLWLVRVANR